MAVKILERCLCPSCEKLLTDGHIVHKEVPYSLGTAKCENCHKRRYCTRYKIIIGGMEEESADCHTSAAALARNDSEGGGR